MLIVRTSSTHKGITGKESGFRRAIGTGGKPGVRVYNFINLGDTYDIKTLGPVMGSGLKGVTKQEGGGAKARGC